MARISGVPHPFPYQGSKRQLASQIVGCIPSGTERFVEAFVGSGAVTLACAHLGKAERYLINDAHESIMRLWDAIIYNPESLADEYEKLWVEQRGRERTYYDQVRERFNRTGEPQCFLYLLARCVKAAVRYNRNGEFNNSPDNRRLGMRPQTMRMNLLQAAGLLRGRVTMMCTDYKSVLGGVTPEDIVYMDPPYQGVCESRDQRYIKGVAYEEFAKELRELDKKGVPFIVSYDGRTGDKEHGRTLPENVDVLRVEIAVGRSTQATLLGRRQTTVESLYISRALLDKLGRLPNSVQSEPLLPLFDES